MRSDQPQVAHPAARRLAKREIGERIVRAQVEELPEDLLVLPRLVLFVGNDEDEQRLAVLTRSLETRAQSANGVELIRAAAGLLRFQDERERGLEPGRKPADSERGITEEL